MNEDYIIPGAILGAILWLFILYQIIYSAVKNATNTQNYNLKMQNRLLIKFLKMQGVSTKELADLHNQDNDEFWKGLEDPVEQKG